MQSRRVLFRVVYGCIYLLLYVLLVGLLFVTPGDAIARSLHNDQNYNVWIVAVSFVVTVVVVCLVYMVRLWVTKTALGSIPKSWVPIEKGDVKDSVYKMIAAGLDRSAIIAYESQPRVEMMEREKGGGGGGGAAPRSRPGGLSTAEMASQELGITLPPPHAIWGDIEHNGWASPQSPDVPDLHYDTVLSELPNLIEGKALTLAPTDPTSPTGAPALDAVATGLVQRSACMSLRGYVDHLAELDVVPVGAATAEFVARYEYARFSTRALSNAQFRELMHLFAQLLRAMRPMDVAALDGRRSAAPSESDIDNDAPLDTNPPSPQTSLSPSTTRRPARREASSSSGGFAAPPRRQLLASQPSSSSLRSKDSASSAGSVIRLATRDDPDELPYVLTPGGGHR